MGARTVVTNCASVRSFGSKSAFVLRACAEMGMPQNSSHSCHSFNCNVWTCLQPELKEQRRRVEYDEQLYLSSFQGSEFSCQIGITSVFATFLSPVLPDTDSDKRPGVEQKRKAETKN